MALEARRRAELNSVSGEEEEEEVQAQHRGSSLLVLNSLDTSNLNISFSSSPMGMKINRRFLT